jgi:hypothetical protein
MNAAAARASSYRAIPVWIAASLRYPGIFHACQVLAFHFGTAVGLDFQVIQVMIVAH